MNAMTALIMVGKAEMKPFTFADYDAFSGVTSECPMIGECDGYLIVIDGNEIQIMDEEATKCFIFRMNDGIQIF